MKGYSRVSCHSSQLHIDVPVDGVHAGEMLRRRQAVALAELGWCQIVVLANLWVLCLAGHHQGGDLAVNEVFLCEQDVSVNAPSFLVHHLCFFPSPLSLAEAYK